MSAITLHYAWPTSTFYAFMGKDKPPLECRVFSFLGQKGNKFDIYRQIIRISDGAHQTLKAHKEYPNRLYFDPKCTIATAIPISSTWSGGIMHRRTESAISTSTSQESLKS